MNYREILEKVQTISLPDWSDDEWAEFTVKLYNQKVGELTGYDCKKCLNRGYSYRVGENLIPICVPCECREIRASLSAMEKSGLASAMERLTFENFKTAEPWQRAIKKKAEEFVLTEGGEWFFVSGTPGSGKTHICTAICTSLLESGKSVRYFVWPHEIRRLKSMVNEPEYDRVFDDFFRADVLYIDDLFKLRSLSELTNADITRTFEIINARYSDNSKKTIISSEWNISEIIKTDSATGSRIYQRAGEFVFDLSRDTRRNYRLYGGKKNESKRDA